MKNPVLVVLVLALTSISTFSGEPTKPVRHPGVAHTAATPQATLMNINNISAWYNSDGVQENKGPLLAAGLTFPRHTATAGFASGVLFGGKVYDGGDSVLRVTGTTYRTGLQPGRIIGIRTGTVEDPANPSVRMWRIRRDYYAVDHREDASEYFGVPVDSVNQTQIDSIRNMYHRDWSEWPVFKGAPYIERNGVPGFQPPPPFSQSFSVDDLIPGHYDEPGLEAHGTSRPPDQVIWYVCNDFAAMQPWASLSSGIEMQTTLWAFRAIPNVIFKRFRLFYKGRQETMVGAHIDSMYIAHWADVDIGSPANDLAGCDTLITLGYAYNGTPTDDWYTPFSLSPPALGYDLIQGPVRFTGNPLDSAIVNFRRVHGAVNTRMCAFIRFRQTFGEWDPVFFSYDGTVQFYQVLRGLPPQPQGPPDPPLRIDPISGLPTPFWFSGNPVTQQGWLDQTQGDKRFVVSSGPFSMALGDSQEIVVAVVAGVGSSNLLSIDEMKASDAIARYWYQSGSIISGAESESENPVNSSLYQNYPNPFNPSTRIAYRLAAPGHVSLRIFDILGKEVRTLVDAYQQSGATWADWDGTNSAGDHVASGVYFYTLHSGSVHTTKRMLLVR